MDNVVKIETFARIGYLARALVYFLIGYLTLSSGHSEGTASVLADIRDMPLGTPLLLLTAAGLFGYGIFRSYGAAIDIRDDGEDAKGLAKRIGHAASGIAHLVLAYLATKIALSGGDAGNGGTEAAENILDLPGGAILLAVVGLGMIGAAANQAVKAATGKFMDLLDTDAPHWTEVIGRVGYAARAAVFAALAWQVLDFTFGASHEELSFQAALDSLRETAWLYNGVALGLLTFGVFSLVMARYRRIRATNVVERLRKASSAFF